MEAEAVGDAVLSVDRGERLHEETHGLVLLLHGYCLGDDLRIVVGSSEHRGLVQPRQLRCLAAVSTTMQILGQVLRLPLGIAQRHLPLGKVRLGVHPTDSVIELSRREHEQGIHDCPVVRSGSGRIRVHRQCDLPVVRRGRLAGKGGRSPGRDVVIVAHDRACEVQERRLARHCRAVVGDSALSGDDAERIAIEDHPAPGKLGYVDLAALIECCGSGHVDPVGQQFVLRRFAHLGVVSAAQNVVPTYRGHVDAVARCDRAVGAYGKIAPDRASSGEQSAIDDDVTPDRAAQVQYGLPRQSYRR